VVVLILLTHDNYTEKRGCQKKNIVLSLSIQKEIDERRLNMESEVNTSMNELRIRTLLHQSGIQKNMGYSTATLLLAVSVPALVQCGQA
jgi:hypothetical protein